jgi:hypothetical protein
VFRLDRRDPLPRRAKKYTLNVEIPTASRQPITAKAPVEFTAVTPERAKVLNYFDITFDSTVKTEKDCGPPAQKAAGSCLVQSRHGPIWAKEPWQRWHRWPPWQPGICKLQAGLLLIVFESPLSAISKRFKYSRDS